MLSSKHFPFLKQIDEASSMSRSFTDHGTASTSDTGGDNIPFATGSLHELWSRENQADEGSPFLHCGMKPRPGLRTETIVYLDDAKKTGVRLSGVVTSVGELPAFSDWIRGDNFCRRLPHCSYCNLRPLAPSEETYYKFPTTCVNHHCYSNRVAIDKSENYMYTMMKRCLLIHGSLHNQEIVSYASLHPDFDNSLAEEKDMTVIPFQAGRVYKILCRAQDSVPLFHWKVSSIIDVTYSESYESLPKEFRDFAYSKPSALTAIGESSNKSFNDEDGEKEDDDELTNFLNTLHNEKMDSWLHDV